LFLPFLLVSPFITSFGVLLFERRGTKSLHKHNTLQRSTSFDLPKTGTADPVPTTACLVLQFSPLNTLIEGGYQAAVNNVRINPLVGKCVNIMCFQYSMFICELGTLLLESPVRSIVVFKASAIAPRQTLSLNSCSFFGGWASHDKPYWF
jgi:hypothetical protein